MGAFSGLSASGDLIADYLSMEAETGLPSGDDARPDVRSDVRSAAACLLEASHRLRSPLNAINGFAAMLRDAAEHGLSDSVRQEYAGYILQSGDKLLADLTLLMSAANFDAADAARGEAGDPSHLDIAARLSGLLASRIEKASNAGVAFDDKTEDGPLLAFTDAALFDYALEFAVDAAIERASKGQTVFVRALAAKDGGLEVSIRDFGQAIDRPSFEARGAALSDASRGPARIFALHDGADGTSENADPLWLIRLLLAEHAMRALGGDFSFKSREGQGALVTLSLPQSGDPSAAQSLE